MATAQIIWLCFACVGTVYIVPKEVQSPGRECFVSTELSVF